jgi:KUP system potassium uptake protein
LVAVGIVFGDLGTSPLYTYQSIVSSVGGHASVPVAMGLLSLVVWALIITVSLKYSLFVMRADNHGEGGILPLMALVTSRSARGRWSTGTLTIMGLFGAALIWRRHHHTRHLGSERP